MTTDLIQTCYADSTDSLARVILRADSCTEKPQEIRAALNELCEVLVREINEDGELRHGIKSAQRMAVAEGEIQDLWYEFLETILDTDPVHIK